MKIIQLQFCEFIMALSINVLCKLVNFYKLCKLLNSLFYNVKKKKLSDFQQKHVLLMWIWVFEYSSVTVISIFAVMCFAGICCALTLAESHGLELWKEKSLPQTSTIRADWSTAGEKHRGKCMVNKFWSCMLISIYFSINQLQCIITDIITCNTITA